MQYETITMPDAGIGSFLTSNMDEIDDNVLMFGNGGGINSMKEVADRMAAMGNGTDTYIIHASEKEIMLPREVAERNPELVGQIKQAIASEGADPEAYVVGSDRNSINPMTGQREFLFKKLVRGIKKVFKKAAKIILPVAAVALTGGLAGPGLFGMGAAGTAALASGVGSLIQGESIGDALKSAAIAGLGTGLVGGISSGISAATGSSFLGVTAPQGATFGSAFTQGAIGTLPAGFKPGVEKFFGVGEAAAAPQAFDTVGRINELTASGLAEANATTIALQEAKIANAAAAAGGKSSLLGTAVKYGLPSLLAAGAAGAFDPIPAEDIDLTDLGINVGGDGLGDGSGDLSTNPLASSTDVYNQNPDKYSVGVPGSTTFFTPSEIVVPSAAIYGPNQGSIANLYANLVPSGAGTDPILPSSATNRQTGTPREVAEVVIPGYDPTVTGMRPATIYGIDALGNPVMSPYADPIMPARFVGSNEEVRTAASGGAMNFPRRTGQIEGPGTGTSDDIPAMLSDGEFVMTAKAVKNAGGGSREQGFRKMYDIMRSFEGGAVA